MSIKALWSLTTPAGTNEQAGVGQITVTTTGTSREYPEIAQLNSAIIFLDVSAASGTTPSLTVSLQQQDPFSLKWQDVVVFAAQTAVTGATPLAAQTLELYAVTYRLSWIVSGTTPSFTFSCGVVAGSEEPAP